MKNQTLWEIPQRNISYICVHICLYAPKDDSWEVCVLQRRMYEREARLLLRLLNTAFCSNAFLSVPSTSEYRASINIHPKVRISTRAYRYRNYHHISELRTGQHLSQGGRGKPWKHPHIGWLQAPPHHQLTLLPHCKHCNSAYGTWANQILPFC